MRTIQLNPIEDVKSRLISHFKDYPLEQENIATLDSMGRTSAESIVSDQVIPAYRKSTVDGYAFKGEPPLTLSLSHKMAIETPEDWKVDEGTIYVATGARVPEDATAVIKREHAILKDGRVYIKEKDDSVNIIEAGDDMTIGDIIIPKDKVMDAFDIGAMVSLGITRCKVYKKPRVMILSTGNELVDFRAEKTYGQTRDINSHTLSLIAKDLGFDVISADLVEDRREVLKTALQEALDCADIVLISGGSSMGDQDYTYDVMTELGDVLSDGMALKPGKPTIVGKITSKLVIGLPGHPVSAIMVFRILSEALAECYHTTVPVSPTVSCELTRSIRPAKGRDTYQMVNVHKQKGRWLCQPTSGKSGMITLLTKSNGYTIIPKECKQIGKGTQVTCYRL